MEDEVTPISLRAALIRAESEKLRSQLMRDYTAYHQLQSQVSPITAMRDKPLTAFTDAELIMDMLRRGYAVLKCPEPGEPPETLKDG